MSHLRLIVRCVFLFALLAAYLPTVYIRQTNKAVKHLEKLKPMPANRADGYFRLSASDIQIM